MRTFNVMRCVFSVSLTAAVLCACGGSSISLSADHNTTNAGDALKGNKTFYYTGKKQKFVVPARVRQLTVVAHGGQGGFSVYDSGNTAGFPARVYAIIPVHPGDTLYVRVGGSGAHGGFNGGGAGGSSDQASYPAYAGGGASDVRLGGDRLADRIIVAAGGGGVGVAIDRYAYGYGGNGGGSSGHSGGGGGGYAAGAGGAGGTQSQGGAGGAGGAVSSRGSYLSGQPGANGALGRGGNGGNAAPYCDAGGGGGGGGGYYGGGGGGGGAGAYSCINAGNGGGGGGGSSYVEPSAIKFRTWNGWKRTGDGLVVFSWN